MLHFMRSEVLLPV